MYTLLILLLIGTAICWKMRFNEKKKDPAYEINPLLFESGLDVVTTVISVFAAIGIIIFIAIHLP